MKNKEDFTKYWEQRISKIGNNIRSVGHKSFTNNENNLIYKAKFNILDKLSNKIIFKGKKLLDAGSGIGIFSDYYSKKGAEVYSIDGSPTAIEFTKKKAKIKIAKVAKLDKIPFKNNFFDLVHCFDVLYHIVDDNSWELSLKEFNRVLKKNGYLIILDFWKEKDSRPREHVKIRSRRKYLSVLKKLNFELVSEHELYFVLQRNYLLTKLSPKLCLKLEKAYNYKIFKRFYGAKIVVFRKLK